jgi:peptide/nickel transport system substrate-binding protein
MTMLIDREAFIRDIVNGLGQITTGPFSPLSAQYNSELEPYPYDPERAQQLLADAGWVDTDNDGILEDASGREFRFDYVRSTLSSPTAERSIQFLKESFKRAGIIMNLNAQDWSVLTDTVDRRDFDAVSFAWSASAPESDPNQLWHSEQINNAGDNFAQWSNPRADELIDRGRATLDDDQRMEIWNELHAEIHEDQPYTFLYAMQWLRFISKEVGNVHTHPIGLEIGEMFMKEPGI